MFNMVGLKKAAFHKNDRAVHQQCEFGRAHIVYTCS